MWYFIMAFHNVVVTADGDLSTQHSANKRGNIYTLHAQLGNQGTGSLGEAPKSFRSKEKQIENQNILHLQPVFKLPNTSECYNNGNSFYLLNPLSSQLWENQVNKITGMVSKLCQGAEQL